MPGAAVADVEPDTSLPGGCDRGEQSPAVVEDAVWRWRVHVGDDVAPLQQREDGGQWRGRLTDVHHHGEVERLDGGPRATHRFKILIAHDGPRETRFHADDDIAVTGDCRASRGDVGAAHVHELAVAEDAGPGEIEEHARRDSTGSLDISACRRRPPRRGPRAPPRPVGVPAAAGWDDETSSSTPVPDSA